MTEARLASADVALTAARVAVASRTARLDRQRAPLAALLAGLATMGRRPPILALADTKSIAELVRVRALIDGSMPVIARRSAALQAELDEGRRLAATADAARKAVGESRAALVEQQQRFAVLEAQASARAAALRASASGAEDQVLAGGEAVLDLGGEAAAASAARKVARELAGLPLAAPRPFARRFSAAASAAGLCLAHDRAGDRRARERQRRRGAVARHPLRHAAREHHPGPGRGPYPVRQRLSRA